MTIMVKGTTNTKVGFVLGHEYNVMTMVPGRTGKVLQDISRIKRMGLCNGFRVASDFYGFKEGEFDALSEEGRYFIVVDLFRCRRKTIDMVLDKMPKYGNKVWACLFGERDVACAWQNKKGYFASRKEAALWFKNWVMNEAWASGWQRYHLRDEKSSRLPGGNFATYLQQSKRLPWINLMAHGAVLFAVHHYYEWGFGFVWLEHNYALHNVNLGIAFLRGAAHQYNKSWGLDLSPFCPGGPPSESLLLREWLFGYLSGANLVHIEGSDLLIWKGNWAGNENVNIRKLQLNRYGKNARQFADFCLRNHANRGKPYVPVAIMLEHDHGWDPPRYEEPYFVWGNKVPYEAGDRMIECFFEWLFPGYRLASYRGYDTRYSPDIPWKSDEEYLRYKTNGRDERRFERGILTSTRWGDCFDVILENCPQSVLNNYKVVVLLGGIKLGEHLMAKLNVYVRQGGKVIINSSQLLVPGPKPIAQNFEGYAPTWSDGIKEFLGASVVEPREDVYGPCQCELCGQEFREHRYMFTRFKKIRDEVLATNHRGQPVALRHRVGKGEVITIAPIYGTSLEVLEPLNIVSHIFDHIFGEVIPIRIDGPAIQYLVNMREKGFWVALFNNSEKVWTGSIRILAPLYSGERIFKIIDIWNEKAVFYSCRRQELIVRAGEIVPFSFAIYEVDRPDL